MKIHLMIMTALLSFCVANNCEAAGTKGDNGAACASPIDCKSEVCGNQICEQGHLEEGVPCQFDEECASGECGKQSRTCREN